MPPHPAERPEPASIAARLDRLPPTRSHREATVIAGIGTFFDLFDIFLAGVLGTVLVEHFALSRAALPPILASSFVGMFLGAACLGWVADRLGRRTAFLVNLGVYSIFTLAAALSTSAAMLIGCRFVAGIGLGAELLLVDAYVASWSRGRCGAATRPGPIRWGFSACRRPVFWRACWSRRRRWGSRAGAGCSRPDRWAP
jgi:putative MFS transporter